MVLLEDVTAGDFRLGIVVRAEFCDIDAVFAAADFFLEDINAKIMEFVQATGLRAG